MVQVVNHGVGLQDAGVWHARKAGIGRFDTHAGTVKNQIPGQLGECGPGQGTRRLEARRHIGVHRIFHLCGDVEVALFRVGERQVVQVTLDAKLGTGDSPGLHGIPHIGIHVGPQYAGQVAVDTGALAPAERARQIQHTREAGLGAGLGRVTGVPPQAHLALRIGIGKLDVLHLQRDTVPIHLPAGVGHKFVEGQQRVVEHTGQVKRTALDVHRRPPAQLVQIEIHIGTTYAWNTHRVGPGGGLRGNGQPRHAATGLVFLGHFQKALP